MSGVLGSDELVGSDTLIGLDGVVDEVVPAVAHDPPDPRLGKDLTLTPDGDLAVTHAGSLQLSEGLSNCGQAIMLWTRTHRGALPLHADYGSDLATLLGGKQDDAHLALATATSDGRRLVENDRRFVAFAPTLVSTDGPDLIVAASADVGTGDTITVFDLSNVRPDELNLQPGDDLLPLAENDPGLLTALQETGDDLDGPAELEDLLDPYQGDGPA